MLPPQIPKPYAKMTCMGCGEEAQDQSWGSGPKSAHLGSGLGTVLGLGHQAHEALGLGPGLWAQSTTCRAGAEVKAVGPIW